MTNEPKIFNEESLRNDIIKTWGKAGAHIEVYDMLLKRAKSEVYVLAQISHHLYPNWEKFFSSADAAKSAESERDYKGKVKWKKCKGGFKSSFDKPNLDLWYFIRKVKTKF